MYTSFSVLHMAAKSIFYALLAGVVMTSCAPVEKEMQPLGNPVLPGYFADPSVVQLNGTYYMYATADPWGTDFLSCWTSDDFHNWEWHKLNWPTKEACTSPLSNDNMVWAPSVVERGGMYYMYVSVGSEVWCGKAASPLGPWENALGDKPLIPADTTMYYHAIDAEAFIDDDGKAYLYWGSGWNWTNGHCFVAELNDDMCSFKGEPEDVTPAHYFEGPFMVKRNGNYFLTYSEGKTIDTTYEVRYAVGDNPFGPFTEADNSPILETHDDLKVYGPGHHTVVTCGGKDYILYHKHRLPYEEGTTYRQTCIAPLEFTGDTIKTIKPLDSVMFPLADRLALSWVEPASVEASGSESADFAAQCAFDKSNLTRWQAAEGDSLPVLTANFNGKPMIDTVRILPEYPWKQYYFKIETSQDNGSTWSLAADYTQRGATGSPILVAVGKECDAVKVEFAQSDSTAALPSLWEVKFQGKNK